MRRGTCVKCGAATVRAAQNGIAIGDQPTARLRPHVGPGFRGAVQLQQTDLWAFACATCGYVEFHLLDPNALAWLAHHWAEVPPPAV